MMLWMEYSLLVALLLTLAAHGAEKVVRLNGRATRWVWLGALLLSLGLPAVLPWLMRALASDGAGLLVPSTVTVSLALPPVVSDAARGISWTRVARIAWLAASALLLAYGAWSLLRLQLARRQWRSTSVLYQAVLISENTGPAVVGVLEPAIVLPEWVGTLPQSEQALILAHECAHIEAGDPWLMRAAQLAPVLMPWNIPLWLQARRLRDAIELDCDARLVAAGENVDGYAELLLNVGQRATRVVLAAAMAEPRSLLEKRIMRMFEQKPRRVLLRASAWLVVAVVALFAAFNAPLPAKSVTQRSATGHVRVQGNEQVQTSVPIVLKGAQKPQERPAAVQEQVRAQARQDQQQQDPQPTFTPFTVGPTLKNVEDVSLALRVYYPPLLRDAGIGGVVKMWFYINERGEVIHLRVKASSGHQALDEAALKVAETMEFTPAKNRDRDVAVWVDMPIVFRAKNSAQEPARTAEQEARLAEVRRQEARLGRPATSAAIAEVAETDRQKRQRVQGAAPAVSTAEVAETGRQKPRTVAGAPTEVAVEARTVQGFPTRTPEAAESGTPELLNAAAVAQGLQRYYPPVLRDAGIGGEVVIWFYVNEEGVVTKTALKKSSGRQALDDAALKVADLMRFAPALKNGQPIAAWIDLPVVFRTQ